MPVVLARIDDRLIRGKYIGMWTRSYNVTVIVIVDDQLAANKIQLDIYALTTPPGVQLFAQSVDGFIDKYQKGVFEKYKVMVIFRDTIALTKITKANLKFPIHCINIGGMKFKDGKIKLTESVSVSPLERDQMIELHHFGYDLEDRQLPTYESIDLFPLITATLK